MQLSMGEFELRVQPSFEPVFPKSYLVNYINESCYNKEHIARVASESQINAMKDSIEISQWKIVLKKDKDIGNTISSVGYSCLVS